MKTRHFTEADGGWLRVVHGAGGYVLREPADVRYRRLRGLLMVANGGCAT